VVVDGLGWDMKPGGDVGIARPLGKQAEHVELTMALPFNRQLSTHCGRPDDPQPYRGFTRPCD
jgi:hypothetical protein